MPRDGGSTPPVGLTLRGEGRDDDERTHESDTADDAREHGRHRCGAALGGAGTMAFFSDDETFTNNELVAGSLDMKMDWQESYNGEKVEAFPERDGDDDQDGPYSLETILDEPELVGLDGTATTDELRQAYKDQFADVPRDLAERKPVIHLDDVKPGDWGEVTFSLHLFDNPGYVWLLGDLVENADNSLTEPEKADEDEVDGLESGELADAIQVVVWHDDGDNVREDEEIIAIGKPADVDDDIVYAKEEALIVSGSLADVLDQLDGKTPLDANVLTDERDCLPNSTTRYVGFKWWLPSSVGNEVQTDSVTFDFGFYTEQCRHNDGSGLSSAGNQQSDG
ncbi:SipW-dependent-type signal peptide-containing protein [Halobacteriaceae archaeon GCM10025711]